MISSGKAQIACVVVGNPSGGNTNAFDILGCVATADKWDNRQVRRGKGVSSEGSCLHNKQLQAMGSLMQQVRSSSSVGEQTQNSIRCFARKTRNDRKCMREFDSRRAHSQHCPLPDLASRAETMPRRLHPRPKMLISNTLFSSVLRLDGLSGSGYREIGPCNVTRFSSILRVLLDLAKVPLT